MFKSYIDKQEEYYGKVSSVRFRDKKSGWKSYSLALDCCDGKTEFFSHKMDPFFKLFLRNYSLNKLCYECEYKGPNSLADFSIGDAWGYISNNLEDDDTGISLVLINTLKGKRTFEEIKDYLEYKKAPDYLLNDNLGYGHMINLPVLRDVLFAQYARNNDFNLLCSAVNIMDLKKEYKNPRGKNVVLWGMGKAYDTYRKLICEKYNVIAVCDNNQSEWGKLIDGLKVVSPKELRRIPDCFIIIMMINEVYIDEAIRQIIKIDNVEYAELREVMIHDWEIFI